ncbi:RNA polymerase sigma factor [Umezawaea endophytica]|uniref:RNA polymerase sigma factor n=1 Tax=Umezawaea endophytica TaxID=1654476 RepID=A0A9X3AHM2_9PSEU|nr:RNA polymerase sigma factor [Umezawaea endophytica]MCS7481216.1 RNA polymerase sigma factor [Umezawaea endophytica]
MTELDALVSSAASGDAAAVNALLERVRPVVLRTCARFLDVPEDVEDAAQEALLRLAGELPTRPPDESFRGWMYALVVNVARQRFRLVHRAETAQPLPGDLADPRRTSVVAGSRLDLLSALDRLHTRQPLLAEALVYRDVCKLGYDEIADVLGVPLSTVKSRIHDARRTMRTELEAR